MMATEADESKYVGMYDEYERSVVRAALRPTRTDNLRPGVAAFVGTRGRWLAAWVADRGAYAGQMLWEHEHRDAMPWLVPTCDLADIEEVGRAD